MSIYSIIESFLGSKDRASALDLASNIANSLDGFAQAKNYLALTQAYRTLNDCFSGEVNRDAVFAGTLYFPIQPSAVKHLLSEFKDDVEVREALIANILEHQSWRYSTRSMESIIKDLAWRGQQDLVIAILDSIINHASSEGPGLDLVQVATEFSLDGDDHPIQAWVAKNEQRLMELDANGGISDNSLVSEGISWHQKGVTGFGLMMANRNPNTASGEDLLRLETIQGKPLSYPGNPTGYKDDWLYYLLLTPYSIDRYEHHSQSFDHEIILKTLDLIKQAGKADKLQQARVHQIARLGLMAKEGANGKWVAKVLGDYKKSGFPLPKSWIRQLLNDVAASNHLDIEAFSETLRVAKSHRVSIDFTPFEAEFRKALSASARKLSFQAGMALLQAVKDGCPIPPRFFGTWFRHSSKKWAVNERANFLQAAPNEVLQACEHIRDKRMASDLGL